MSAEPHGIVADAEDPCLESLVRRQVSEEFATRLRSASLLGRWILRWRMRREIARRTASVLRASAHERGLPPAR